MEELLNSSNHEYLEQVLVNSNYTSCYCEENVYNFLNCLPPSLQSSSYAVFISNSSESNLLFHQKASTKVDAHNWVIWDYHVVAIVDLRDSENGNGKVVIVDQDSTLGNVTELKGMSIMYYSLSLTRRDVDQTYGCQSISLKPSRCDCSRNFQKF